MSTTTSASPPLPTLYTFTISHFSEKVRWALDLEGIEYVERPLVPGAHIAFVRMHAPKNTVPLLKDNGRYIQGSGAIVDHVEATRGLKKLVPISSAHEAEAAEIEKRADHAFGLGTQRIFYNSLLKDPKMIAEMWLQNSPWWGAPFYKVMFPLITRGLRRGYRIEPEAVERAMVRFRSSIADIDGRLKQHRYILSDEGPSRLDIAVASLLAPMCQPPEHVLKWPELDRERDPELTKFLEQFEDGPTWRWVLQLYRDHRRTKS